MPGYLVNAVPTHCNNFDLSELQVIFSCRASMENFIKQECFFHILGNEIIKNFGAMGLFFEKMLFTILKVTS